MKKIIVLLIGLLLFTGCLSFEMRYQTEVSFSPVEFERVWSACIAEILDRSLTVTLSDKASGLLVACVDAELFEFGETITYTVNIRQSEDGVLMKVLVDVPPLYGSASRFVNEFIDDVEVRLN